MDLESLSRFWDKVEKPSDCWLWQSSITAKGYGDFHLNGKTVLAHRFAWMLANGPIPGDLCVLHHCDTPLCVNPAHLFLGTHMDNMQDMRKKNRTGRPLGENHWASKVTEEQIEEMRSMYESGQTQRSIAEIYRLHPATVSRMVRGLGRRKDINNRLN